MSACKIAAPVQVTKQRAKHTWCQPSLKIRGEKEWDHSLEGLGGVLSIHVNAVTEIPNHPAKKPKVQTQTHVQGGISLHWRPSPVLPPASSYQPQLGPAALCLVALAPGPHEGIVGINLPKGPQVTASATQSHHGESITSPGDRA